MLDTTTQLLRWMLCGLEIARLVNEFEDSNIVSTAESNYKHHEQTKCIQHTFQQQVNDLVYVIQDIINPFTDKSDDLLVLDTRGIVDPSVAESIKHLTYLGKQQYETYVQERLATREQSVTDTIKQTKLPLFSRPPFGKQSKQKLELVSLKETRFILEALCVVSGSKRRP